MLRLWLSSLLLLFLALPAAAQEAAPYMQLVEPNAPVLYRSTCTVNDAATTSPVTQTGVTIPGLVAGDIVHFYVGVFVEDGATNFSCSSLTVDGAAANEYEDEAGSGAVNTCFYGIGPVAYDGSVDVAPTYSESITSSGVCVWAVKQLRSNTETSSGTDDDTASGDLVLTTATTAAGGYVLCVSNGTSTTSAETVAWGVVTELEDTQSAEQDYSNADGVATGDSMANTANWSASNDASGSCVAVR
jgi:hypothetical protein